MLVTLGAGLGVRVEASGLVYGYRVSCVWVEGECSAPLRARVFPVYLSLFWRVEWALFTLICCIRRGKLKPLKAAPRIP